MASALTQTLRERALYAYGYTQGRYFDLPTSLSELYGKTVSKLTSGLALPLPLLSFLALPFFGGSATSINLVFFYLTWSAIIVSHDPLHVEIYGTLLVRGICFLLPALGFLAFDCAIPSLSSSIKARGDAHLPQRLHRQKLLKVIVVATFNTLLAVALQAALEYLATTILHTRSILKVTTAVPLPWNIAKHLVYGLLCRGLLHYPIHRFILHQNPSPFRTWHQQWQHSLRLPFSLAAAYDHPLNHLLATFLPLYLPAALFRFHVLTYHLLLAITSLEDLFLYSGYAVLPSSIVVAGMARRTDGHFATSASSKADAGNFGHWGVLDFVCGTGCPGEAGQDVVEDVKEEGRKHDVKERAGDAIDGAVDGLRGWSVDEDEDADDGEEDVGVEGGEDGEDGDFEPEEVQEKQPTPGKRRSKRGKGKK
ncbi:hypothetical protein MBLNU230_g6581t1 [Neophaeotheca triangularis]